jgi:hypothetical protein
VSATGEAAARVVAEAIQWYRCASGMRLNRFEEPLFAAVQAHLAVTDSTTRITADVSVPGQDSGERSSGTDTQSTDTDMDGA